MFEILREKCGLSDQAGPVLVGVSGGADSLSLLHFLHAAGCRPVCATFNHGLRAEAGQELEHVRHIAVDLNIPFVADGADVAAHAAAEGLSIEDAARTLRYGFLFRAAREAGAQAVAVGHTADDQAETVLMHFLRGAGLAGLKGMPYRTILPVFDTELPLVRPLLGWWRADTERYCRENGLSPIDDPSNADTVYFRNRLRHELIPQLERYNPRFREALVRTALGLQGDDELLAELVDSAWQQSVREGGAGFVAFKRTALESMPAALRRNLFRRAAFTLRPGLRDLDFEALERAALLKPADLAGGLRLFIEGGTIYLAVLEADLPSVGWPQISGPLQVAGERVPLDDGWLLACEQVSVDPQVWRPGDDDGTAWLDADVLQAGLNVRAMRAGERFRPLGMGGNSVKLQDFFVNIKLPKRARAKWPLVCVGDEIAWVGGLRLAHPYRVTEHTRMAVRLTLRKP